MKTVSIKPNPATHVDLLAASSVADKTNDFINRVQNRLFVWMLFTFLLSFFENTCAADHLLEIGFPGSEVISNQHSLLAELCRPVEIDFKERAVVGVTGFNFVAPSFSPCEEGAPPFCFGIVQSLAPNFLVALSLAPPVEPIIDKPTNNSNADTDDNSDSCPIFRGWRWYHWILFYVMCFLAGACANAIRWFAASRHF